MLGKKSGLQGNKVALADISVLVIEYQGDPDWENWIHFYEILKNWL